MIDSHVNLHHEAFASDLGEVLDRARSKGLGPFLTICDKLASLDAIRAIVSAHSDIAYTVGAHPHFADDHETLMAAQLADLTADPRVAGIGETGLDLHYGHSTLAAQKRVFRAHIHAAQQTGLPLIVHTREADGHTSDMLREESRSAPFALLLHCYTSGLALAELGMELGGYISASGIVSFRNAEDVREVFRRMPQDRIIVETDCPYLAPIPHRGRRCEPSFLPDVIAALAAARNEPPEHVAAYTRSNTLRLFERLAALAPDLTAAT